MGRNQIPKQTKDKEDKKDTENLRGKIRELQKTVTSQKKEIARLTKHIDTRYEMIDDYMTGLEHPEIHDEFSGWRCPKCKHNAYDELVLRQGETKTKIYRTCQKCGHKERTEHDASEQGNASLDTRRK